MAIPAYASQQSVLLRNDSMDQLVADANSFINTGSNYLYDFVFVVSANPAGLVSYSLLISYTSTASGATKEFIWTRAGFIAEINTWLSGQLYTPPSGSLVRAQVGFGGYLMGTGQIVHVVFGYREYA